MLLLFTHLYIGGCILFFIVGLAILFTIAEEGGRVRGRDVAGYAFCMSIWPIAVTLFITYCLFRFCFWMVREW